MIELDSELEITCSMCTRFNLGSLIFYNKSELGLHFSNLSVFLCLIQVGLSSPPPPPRFRRPWQAMSHWKIGL